MNDVLGQHGRFFNDDVLVNRDCCLDHSLAAVVVGLFGSVVNEAEVAAQVHEAVIVVGIRLGRSRVREGNVVTTVVVAAVASVLVKAGDSLGALLVLRLHDGCVVVGKGQRLVKRLR